MNIKSQNIKAILCYYYFMHGFMIHGQIVINLLTTVKDVDLHDNQHCAVGYSYLFYGFSSLFGKLQQHFCTYLQKII